MQHFSGLELRKISISTIIQFVVRMMTSLTTLVTTLLITHFLGLEAVGSFTKVIAFVSIFYLFVDFGFNSVLLRYYFKNVEDQLGNLVILRLILSFIVLPIILLLSILLPYNELAGTGFSNIEKSAIVIFSFTLITMALLNTMQSLMQKKLDYSISLLPTFVSNIILITIVLYAVYFSNFYILLTAYIFAGSLNAIMTYIKAKRKYKIILRLKSFQEFAKTMLLSSWPLATMLILNLLYARADIFLLSFLKPSADVGTYGISYRFFEIALALPTFLANSTYPILLKAYENKNEYQRLFIKYLKVYVGLSFIPTLLIIVLSPLITILGQDLSLSVFPLQILALSLPFFFATSLLQWHFLIQKKLLFLIPLYGSILATNVFINMILIPKYSYIAAAIVTGLCEGLVFLFMLWYFYYNRKSKLG